MVERRLVQLWHEYQIPADFEKQKETIRSLRKWMQNLEKRKLVIGYAFDHYFSNPNEPDELRVRFQYSEEKNREIVEKELEREVKKVVADYVKKERIWDSPEHILNAYEFGTRCAFLCWELIENKRFPEDYFSNFAEPQNVSEQDEKTVFALKRVPKEFQIHFNHGVMNSLGVPKSPNELFVHLDLLMDCTKTHTKQELLDWLQKHLP
jgi:hypothetical protein